MFKNMNIEINEDQPLDEVVRELGRLGYGCLGLTYGLPARSLVTVNGVSYTDIRSADSNNFKTTTLQQLKEM